MSQPVSKSASALGGGVVVQKQKSGVYTVLLALSLIAILVGCGFLYAIIQRYNGGQLATGMLQSAPQHSQAADAALPVEYSSAFLS